MWASIPLRGGSCAADISFWMVIDLTEILSCLHTCILNHVNEYLLFHKIHHLWSQVQKDARDGHETQYNEKSYSKLPARNFSNMYIFPQSRQMQLQRGKRNLTCSDIWNSDSHPDGRDSAGKNISVDRKVLLLALHQHWLDSPVG